eukprot:7129405-Prymnesium_polylepis.1
MCPRLADGAQRAHHQGRQLLAQHVHVNRVGGRRRATRSIQLESWRRESHVALTLRYAHPPCRPSLDLTPYRSRENRVIPKRPLRALKAGAAHLSMPQKAFLT